LRSPFISGCYIRPKTKETIKMKDKISKMKNAIKETDYLRDEYNSIKLWGDNPDGDVKFEKLMEWLAENDYIVEYMLKVSKDIKAI